MSETKIVVRGAREHNLRDVNLTIPRNQLVVMTGVSGSGKSSLAFDTLYAEGQRRYVESLSSYARQFLGQLPKPDVDAISGLSPSISIQQKSTGRNPRSTVGTITEIYDYLRVLFARVGQGYCHKCDRPITAQTPEQIAENIARLPEGTRLQILAPLINRQKGEYRDLFEDLLKQGYLRARVNGNVVNLTDDLQLDRQMRHTIEVVIDRLVIGAKQRSRLAEAVENALKLSGGSLIAAPEATSARRTRKNAPQAAEERLYSSHYACTKCGISYEPPSPQLFSFNSPLGMCLVCNGLGMKHDFNHEKLIPNDKRSVAKGAIELLGTLGKIGRWKRHIYRGAAAFLEKEHSLPADSLLKMPWRDIPATIQNQLLYGTGDRHITFAWRQSGGTWKHGGVWEGFIPELLESYRKAKNPMRRRQLEKYMEIVCCPTCRGARLNQQSRSVRISTASAAYRKRKLPLDLSLSDVCALSIAAAGEFFEQLDLDDARQFIATEILKEIRGRLGFLLQCGLDYLTLERTAPTLSGGESQRIRLAGQIGSGLVGVLYILDEPSIGLHPRDNTQLLNSLLHLRDQGNTVVVVEHDEETMRAADHIVDFGPGPGVRGGEIVAEGTLSQIQKASRSLTGQYISGKRRIDIPQQRRKPGRAKLKIVAAQHNNLKKVDASFPLGAFVCVTGVSGSGKSSLVNDILWQALNKQINKGNGKPGRHTRINGLQHLDKAIDIDQSPIGRTPRSNPATYVKLLDHIRDLYTKLPESKVRGYKPGRFSFNVAAGRCEACEGYGSNKLEMDFLADVWVTCPVCEGRRFNHETLEVRFKGANIAEVLDMDVQQALEHFQNVPKIVTLLQTLHDVGLDYLKLGQPSPTLSGGEAQRIKLARELGKRSTGRTIYLLDEPTTGLHFADVEKLLEVLHGFVEAGNTVLVVEHNLDVIKTADWVIDLGPEGGEGGGTIVAEGTPETIAACKKSYTGKALDEILNPKPKRKRTKKAGRNGSLAAREKQHREIIVSGAAQHNLRSVDLKVPRNRMSVFCGPSGSGKTSLAMDTLYAEGQRRYVESLSAYARQFLGQMPKPKIEHLSGLPPAIAIEQRSTGHTPRSTVGTVTEIYDYLRILYARLGQPYCPDCEIPVAGQTTDEVIEKILAHEPGTKILVLAPREVRVGESFEKLWDRLQSQGFLRVRVDGTTYRLDDMPEWDRRRKLQVEIVVDRLTVNRRTRSRIADSVESGLELGRGSLLVALCDEDRPEPQWRVDRFNLHSACENCGTSFEQLTPHSFSFNSSLGWCDACEGLGTQQGTNLAALIADPKRSINDGAIAVWPEVKTNKQFQKILAALGREFGLPLDVPFQELAPQHQRLVLYGSGERWIALDDKSGVKIQYKGLYPAVEESTRVSFVYRQRLRDMIGETHCSICHGSRLRPDAAAVRLLDKTLQQVCAMPLRDSLDLFKNWKLNRAEKRIAGDLVNEVQGRLSFLVDVGLHYLSLDRPMPTLSGGETQRIRLAGQVGRALTGVLYVLDEPTIGLHARDNGRLLEALKKLRELNNTLILVEHDREVITAADRLYDFGPGAGRLGGTVVGQGTPKQLAAKKSSLTGQYLSGREEIPIPTTRRMQDQETVPPGGGWLEIHGARHHNLRDVDLRIPLGTLTCVTGVSGSGKSSLIEDTLAVALSRRLHHGGGIPGAHDKIVGIDQINKVITVDQQPLGSTPKSNPATYTGVFDHIRELYCRLPDAKVRGYRPGRFSFNKPGGRCDACEGNGELCIEMHFLPDVWVRCDDCNGRRFNEETLAVKYRGKSIADVLEMPIGEAAELFENIPKIRRYMATLSAIGLDYLTLGQSAPTLSGGEAQRVKLAAELARPQTGKTLYILDEPTTGLHFDDIRKLLRVLDSLVEAGNTVVVIEHNLDVIKTSDWIVDMGPEAGGEGGEIVTEGTPEAVVKYATAKKRARRPPSFTGELLSPILAAGKRSEREIFNAREAAKKRAGDLDIAQIGRNAQMPWKKDGRGWHTRDRISHTGAECRWDGAALEYIIDQLEGRPGLKPVNWNSRSTVEIAGPQEGHGWFFHALTGDEWLLSLTFRVPKNTFSRDELREQLALESLDDLDELPVYGRSERVRVKNLKGPWQEVKISIHWLREVDTPEFREFLDTAATAYGKKVTAKQTNINDLTPWKVLGKKWHLSRKGFPSGKRVKWAVDVLDELTNLLERALPRAEVDWGNKQVVYFKPAGSKTVRASVHTKRRGGIDLSLFVGRGQFALGKIAGLGREREIGLHSSGQELIKIRFDSAAQVAKPALKELLKEIAAHTKS
ncbi:UvrABC system protein A [Symmachiella dynata]|uniref:excinuclease ABC subunit UvrA n=1 Tax=Symmachiella dynata TaxID=2527995 RepID=UPI00118AC52A|nr:excinuclease ABC subunit UvrA [Symmachiella dynata]QDT47941.1 UvrABC system protein A [Symmachiella dynata]